MRKNRNLITNRLKRSGHRVDIQAVTQHAPADDNRQELLKKIVVISSKSWKRKTDNSLDQSGPNAFITRLSELAARRNWLSIWLLSLNGTPAAMEYQLRFGDSIHALRADFDPRWRSLSPGTYLNWKILEWLFRSAPNTRYLMGPGRNPYKSQWLNATEGLTRLTAYRPTLHGLTHAIRERYQQRPSRIMGSRDSSAVPNNS